MKKKAFTFIFKPSNNGKTSNEVVNELVQQTIQKVLAQQERKII